MIFVDEYVIKVVTADYMYEFDVTPSDSDNSSELSDYSGTADFDSDDEILLLNLVNDGSNNRKI